MKAIQVKWAFPDTDTLGNVKHYVSKYEHLPEWMQFLDQSCKSKSISVDFHFSNFNYCKVNYLLDNTKLAEYYFKYGTPHKG